MITASQLTLQSPSPLDIHCGCGDTCGWRGAKVGTRYLRLSRNQSRNDRMSTLEAGRYTLLADVFSKEEGQTVLSALSQARAGALSCAPMELNDSGDESNVLYQSTRSQGLRAYA